MLASARLVSVSCLTKCKVMIVGHGMISRRLMVCRAGEKQMHSSGVMRDDFKEQARLERMELEKERMNLDREEDIKYKLLDAALEEILSHGWNKSAVVAAATRLGFPSVMAGLVGGVEEVVLHHIKKSNRALDLWMEVEVARLTDGGARLPVGKFVRSCIITRLSMNIPYIEAGMWAQGVALIARPEWGVASVGLCQEVCDDIWHRAGDSSHDVNWYTKRVSLGLVIASTDVFMIQDTSLGFRDTWDFLDRRLDDLAMIPTLSKIPGDVAGIVEGFLQTAKILTNVQK